MCLKQLIKTLDARDKKDCFSNRTVAKEKGRKFSIKNKSKKTVCKVRVDSCLLTEPNKKKCDFLFKVCETERYFLVELKGTDVNYAVEQIESTFATLNSKLNVPPEQFEAVVVSSAFPRGANKRFQQLRKQCWDKRRLRLRIKSREDSVIV